MMTDNCDKCGQSGVEIARTYDGETICVECDEDFEEDEENENE